MICLAKKKFYEVAVKAAAIGVERLETAGIPFRRPDDFFAEMVKTDFHMSKVKGELLKEKRIIDQSIERRKLRTAKKFSKKVQIEKQQERDRAKKEEQDAIKKWQKKPTKATMKMSPNSQSNF